ncbi:helix-turn-helix domain-containing protein [Kaistia sp. MMO-174]|uniref:helix-turn-helix domain-containing protein n=1 Tax=Kaistia sp. MMO-174 TaxID=3081256 RepID=UPI0030190FDC
MTMPRPSARKPSRINHSPRKAKQNWIYDLRAVAALYLVHPNTVRNWVKQGLPYFRDGKKRLFHGDDLNEFHRIARERRKFPCGPGELYCPRCKQRHSLVGRLVSFCWKNAAAGTLDWECPDGRGRNATYMGRSRYDDLAKAGVNLSSDIDD